MKTLHLDSGSAKIGKMKKYRVTYGGDVYEIANGKYLGFISDPKEVERVRRFHEKRLIKYVVEKFLKINESSILLG